MRPALGGALGSDDLGDHAALADRGTGTARHAFQRFIAGRGFGNQRCSGVLARVSGIKAGLIGQDNQRIGFDQVGDQCAQGIVVAELDLVGDNGIVFVDDRHDTELKQRHQGRAGVQVTLAIGQIVVGEQNLCSVQAVPGKCAFIHLHQPHLADGCCCLQLMDRFRAFAPAQTLHAAGDGAGRNQHHLLALLPQHVDLARPVVDGSEVETSAVIGDEGRADLDDKAAGIGEAADHGRASMCSESAWRSGCRC